MKEWYRAEITGGIRRNMRAFTRIPSIWYSSSRIFASRVSSRRRGWRTTTTNANDDNRATSSGGNDDNNITLNNGQQADDDDDDDDDETISTADDRPDCDCDRQTRDSNWLTDPGTQPSVKSTRSSSSLRRASRRLRPVNNTSPNQTFHFLQRYSSLSVLFMHIRCQQQAAKALCLLVVRLSVAC